MGYLTDRGSVRLDINGLLNPTTDGQWPQNNRDPHQGAQAGGFWRNCRQRHKLL
ncbi:hypothetical protein PMm318_A17530 [Pseudomonas moorei]